MITNTISNVRERIPKMNIALKEAVETEYWIKLLLKTNYLTLKQGESIQTDGDEIVRILHSIVKTTKSTP